MATQKPITPAGARLLTKIAHFKRECKKLPPLNISAAVRAAAEKHHGIKFN